MRRSNSVDDIVALVRSMTIAEVTELRRRLDEEFGDPGAGIREPRKPPPIRPAWPVRKTL